MLESTDRTFTSRDSAAAASAIGAGGAFDLALRLTLTAGHRQEDPAQPHRNARHAG
jgi:hypothetical protein